MSPIKSVRKEQQSYFLNGPKYKNINILTSLIIKDVQSKTKRYLCHLSNVPKEQYR